MGKKITVLALGSRGDVQPYVALGRGLQAAGFTVCVATHRNFELMVRKAGLEFFLIRINPREALETEDGVRWLESGHSPLKFLQRLRDLFEPIFEPVGADCLAACEGCDVILNSGVGGIFGPSVAEKLGVFTCNAYLQPFHPTTEFPLMGMGPGLSFSSTWNQLSYNLAHGMMSWILGPVVNRWRVESLGLPAFDRTAWQHLTAIPTVYGFSPFVVPPPRDWGSHLYVAGYWFLEPNHDWQPPADLQHFLDNGPPPVYIGFGSMAARHPGKLTELCLEALEITAQRGVLMTGWGGLHSQDVPYAVHLIGEVPHDWLFPRMVAVVHHGGAGTTGTGLRAGVPGIVAPFFADQPFWGQRLAALGVGPDPVPQKKLTVRRLAEAIDRAVHDIRMRQKARTLGLKIQAEDGIGRAVTQLSEWIQMWA